MTLPPKPLLLVLEQSGWRLRPSPRRRPRHYRREEEEEQLLRLLLLPAARTRTRPKQLVLRLLLPTT